MEHEYLVIENGVVKGLKEGVDASSIKEINIPEGVTEIDDGALIECAFESVTIPSSITAIRFATFCPYPATVIYGGTLAQWCEFDGDTILVQEAKSMILAGENNMDLKKQTTLEIPDFVTRIGEGAFCGCEKLESVTISERVESIGPVAFYRCLSLESVEIPDSVRKIESGAFSVCASLVSVGIPDSVTSIGESAFDGCKSLKSVNYSGMIEEWEEIEKSGWLGEDGGSPVIHCMDGDITAD